MKTTYQQKQIILRTMRKRMMRKLMKKRKKVKREIDQPPTCWLTS